MITALIANLIMFGIIKKYFFIYLKGNTAIVFSVLYGILYILKIVGNGSNLLNTSMEMCSLSFQNA